MGKLNFAAGVVYGGRTFLPRINDAINTLKKPYHRKRVTDTMRQDISWWINFMNHFNGKTYFVTSEPTATAEFSTDASLVGSCREHFFDDWFYVHWQSDFPDLHTRHINELKLFTVLLALRRWGAQLFNTVTKSWINETELLIPVKS